MSHPEKIIKEFELVWGIAPDDSLKGKKGKEIKHFLLQSHLSYLLESKKRLEGYGDSECKRKELAVLEQKIKEVEELIKK